MSPTSMSTPTPKLFAAWAYTRGHDIPLLVGVHCVMRVNLTTTSDRHQHTCKGVRPERTGTLNDPPLEFYTVNYIRTSVEAPIVSVASLVLGPKTLLCLTRGPV